jgi:hypothetical protein
MSEEIFPLESMEKFLSWTLENMEERGLSQREMLRQASLSHGTVTEMRTSPDMKISTVAKIADVFGFDVALIKRK